MVQWLLTIEQSMQKIWTTKKIRMRATQKMPLERNLSLTSTDKGITQIEAELCCWTDFCREGHWNSLFMWENSKPNQSGGMAISCCSFLRFKVSLSPGCQYSFLEIENEGPLFLCKDTFSYIFTFLFIQKIKCGSNCRALWGYYTFKAYFIISAWVHLLYCCNACLSLTHLFFFLFFFFMAIMTLLTDAESCWEWYLTIYNATDEIHIALSQNHELRLIFYKKN